MINSFSRVVSDKWPLVSVWASETWTQRDLMDCSNFDYSMFISPEIFVRFLQAYSSYQTIFVTFSEGRRYIITTVNHTCFAYDKCHDFRLIEVYVQSRNWLRIYKVNSESSTFAIHSCIKKMAKPEKQKAPQCSSGIIKCLNYNMSTSSYSVVVVAHNSLHYFLGILITTLKLLHE